MNIKFETETTDKGSLLYLLVDTEHDGWIRKNCHLLIILLLLLDYLNGEL